MDSLDLQVLMQARDWFVQGHKVWLVTVIETWGSAPRPLRPRPKRAPRSFGG